MDEAIKGIPVTWIYEVLTKVPLPAAGQIQLS